jgi:hypothetical protein
MTDIDMFLEHHGVKGQKWGVTTKSRGSSKSSKATKPDMSKMSTQELRDAVGRMQLEKQYSDLSKAHNLSASSKGLHFVGDIMKDVGRQEVRKIFVASAATIATGLIVAKNMMKG